MAAALANVDDRDSWRVHFADTMRGGQYVNNWRMAELHAKEAPERVRELEAYGAVFDRTPDGRILQRNFGGHRYPRLAHVGDRTGLELIRTLQDHTIHLGVTVHMEHTVIELLLDDCRRVRRAGLRPRARALSRVLRQGRRARDRRRGARLPDHEQLVGGHGRRARAGLSRRRRAHRHGVRAVPPHRHGVAAEREGHSRDRGRARRRRRAEEQRRPPLHVRRHPGQLQAADRLGRRRGLALHAGRQVGAAPAGAADPRSRRALHQSRGEGRAAAARMAASFSTSPGSRRSCPTPRRTSSGSSRACTTSSRSWPTSTSRRPRWKWGRPRTTSWAGSGWTRTPRSRPFPGCLPRASAHRASMARTGSAATRSPT